MSASVQEGVVVRPVLVVTANLLKRMVFAGEQTLIARVCEQE